MLWVAIGVSPASGITAPSEIDELCATIDNTPLRLDLAAVDSSSPPTISLGLLADDPPATAPDETAQPRFGEPGSRRVFINGGFGIDDDSDTLWQAGASIDWFITDWISLDLGLNGLYIDQTGDDAIGASLVLLLRWHFWRNEAKSMTIYGEGGAGILLTTEDVPFDGSSFNFTPQLGLGMGFDLGDDHWLMTGVRWYHISNAATSSNNPARDSLYLYAGISLPF